MKNGFIQFQIIMNQSKNPPNLYSLSYLTLLKNLIAKKINIIITITTTTTTLIIIIITKLKITILKNMKKKVAGGIYATYSHFVSLMDWR